MRVMGVMGVAALPHLFALLSLSFALSLPHRPSGPSWPSGPSLPSGPSRLSLKVLQTRQQGRCDAFKEAGLNLDVKRTQGSQHLKCGFTQSPLTIVTTQCLGDQGGVLFQASSGCSLFLNDLQHLLDCGVQPFCSHAVDLVNFSFHKMSQEGKPMHDQGGKHCRHQQSNISQSTQSGQQFPRAVTAMTAMATMKSSPPLCSSSVGPGVLCFNVRTWDIGLIGRYGSSWLCCLFRLTRGCALLHFNCQIRHLKLLSGCRRCSCWLFLALGRGVEAAALPHVLALALALFAFSTTLAF
mmetsp:Transcript_61361/g.134351  ORF Transcript_61361/g.134351 Transcript_61361/m.134351 type:complete len:296 (-) Transcript_61361:512-1399(-)